VKDQRQESGDNSQQFQAGRDNIFIYQGVTEERAREIAVEVGRTILVESRAVAGQLISERADHITDMVIERVNVKDPALFARFEDPRFLAALTSAQRSYAETGDSDLADVLAGLVVGLASQPIRSRREIILRQAISVAQQLTTEHINALAVKVYLTSLKLTEPYDTEHLIRAFDTLLSHYYGRVPSSPIDYGYMSSTGVCYTDQLSAFASGPYQILHSTYLNSMYPAFTFSEMRETLLSDENENREEYGQLLGVIAKSADGVTRTDRGTVFANPEEDALFRVAPDHVATVLTNIPAVEQQLTEPQKQLRAMVQPRLLSVEEFQQKVAEVKPELADFLNFIQKTSALNFHLHPVGFIIAQHEIRSRAPQLATLIDAAFDEV
jgi:hypothetical protein